MAAIGVAVGTAVVSTIVEKLASFAVGEAVKVAKKFSQDDLVKELKSLELNLNLIKDLLDDAESKQNKQPGVRAWLEELKDAAYDAEDVLDEYATDTAILRQRKGHVRKWIKGKLIKFTYREKITSVSERFDALKKKMDGLNLRRLEMSDKGNQDNARGRETSALLDAGWPLMGRDIHKEKIIDMLRSDESKNNTCQLHVISIIGVGGVGKTSLAQFVYDDGLVKEHFPTRIWVWVSKNFDAINILKRIISDIEGKTCKLEYLQDLHKKVEELTKFKKFLLILDDAWNVKETDWNTLFVPLKSGDRGSRVIVTMRSSDVARSIKEHVQHIDLEGLDEEHMMSILKRCAFGRDVNPDEHGDLLQIGKDIIKKLKGSPLAAKTIGRLLGTSSVKDHWMSILRSNLWEVEGQQEHDILPSLLLSYHYLHPTLKFCFSLCSLFPKGCQISEEDLSYLWIAHGIFQVGAVGHGNSALGAIQDLRSRSLLSPGKGDDFLTMHDLIHDVSEFVSQEDTLHITDKIKLEKLPNKLRHLSFSRVQWESKFSYDKLRSALCIQMTSYNIGLSKSEHRVLIQMLNESTCLRVLNLQGCQIGVLPKSIGNLKHLRCLNLSHTNISKLPKSLTSLYNLQALWLEHCIYLHKLPDGMGNLVNLRFLKADDTLAHIIKGIRRLGSLQVLKYFDVDPEDGSGIEELENLDMLGGDLTIRGLENVADPVQARQACLKRKECLQGLTLQWSRSGWTNTTTDRIAEEVLEALQPNGDRLKCLEIENYQGRVLPRWLSQDGHLLSLSTLEINNCRGLQSFPESGLPPSLSTLHIYNCPALEKKYRNGPERTMLSHIPLVHWSLW